LRGSKPVLKNDLWEARLIDTIIRSGDVVTPQEVLQAPGRSLLRFAVAIMTSIGTEPAFLGSFREGASHDI
jgi:hypothetical protein